MKNKCVVFLLCLSILLTGCNKSSGNSSSATESVAPADTTVATTAVTTVPEDKNIIEKTDSYSGSEFSNPDSQLKFEGFYSRIKTNLEHNGIRVISDAENAAQQTVMEATVVEKIEVTDIQGTGTETEDESTGGIDGIGGIGGDTGSATEANVESTASATESNATTEVTEIEPWDCECGEKGITADKCPKCGKDMPPVEEKPLTKEDFDFDAWAKKAVSNTFAGKPLTYNNELPAELRIKEEDYIEYYNKYFYPELIRRSLDTSATIDVNATFGENETEKGTVLYKALANAHDNGVSVNMKNLPKSSEEAAVIAAYRDTMFALDSAWINPVSAMPVLMYGLTEEEINSSTKLSRTVDFQPFIDTALSATKYSEYVQETKTDKNGSIKIEYVLTSKPWYNFAVVDTAAKRWVFSEEKKKEDRESKGWYQENWIRQGILDNKGMRMDVSSMQTVTDWNITSELKSDEFITNVANVAASWGITDTAGIANIALATQYIYTPLNEEQQKEYDIDKDHAYFSSPVFTADASIMTRFINRMFTEATSDQNNYPALLEYLQTGSNAFTLGTWFTELTTDDYTDAVMRLAEQYMLEAEENGTSETSEGTGEAEAPAETEAPVETETPNESETGEASEGDPYADLPDDYKALMAELKLVENGITEVEDMDVIIEAYEVYKGIQDRKSREYTKEAIAYAIENVDSKTVIDTDGNTNLYTRFARELKSRVLLKNGYIFISDDCIMKKSDCSLIFGDDVEKYYNTDGKKAWADILRLFDLEKDTYSSLVDEFAYGDLTNACDYAITYSNGGIPSTLGRGEVVDSLDWVIMTPIINGTVTESELRATLLNYVLYVGAFTGESFSRSIDLAISGLVNKCISGDYIFSVEYVKDMAVFCISKG